MYIVVSKWRAKDGRWDDFEKRSEPVRDALRMTPGVSYVQGFRSEDGCAMAIVGYDSQDTYNSVTKNPSGPFEKILAENNLEEVSEWLWSERGESLHD